MRVFLLFTLLSLSGVVTHAQIFEMDTVNVNTCSGYFTDSGGANGNYSDGEHIVMTICSDDPFNTHIRLTFLGGTKIKAPDRLCFFDGTDTLAPPLDCHFDFDNSGGLFIVQATANNNSGCITVQFRSNDTLNDAGWFAEIACIAQCQTIRASLAASDPPVFPADTGYIDICPGQEVSFLGQGFYPQDGLFYNQADSLSTFLWDFGDGTFEEGKDVVHAFDQPGGYTVELTIVDSTGSCKNTNLISQRVRVAPRPQIIPGGLVPDEICAGDTLMLDGSVESVDTASEVSVLPGEARFRVKNIFSDSLPLPDGNGVSYETTITFFQFSPGQTLNNVLDILGICAIMEHSWLRDLRIELFCPDGTGVVLQNHPGQSVPPFEVSEIYLGIPVDDDSLIVPGVGLEYCWTPTATRGTLLDYANSNFIRDLPAGDYNSYEPLDILVGCPLNGDWTLKVTDLWPDDNGMVFSWSIFFDPSLYPNLQSFRPGITDYSWENHPSIFFQSPDSIMAAPPNAGEINYVFEVEDEFGCLHDTVLSVDVLPPLHPDCFNCSEPSDTIPDVTICQGGSAVLNASGINNFTPPSLTFETNPYWPSFSTVGPPADPFVAPLEVQNVLPATFTNPVAQLCGVCLDLESTDNGDLQIYLRAPSNQLLELSTNNGAGGANYSGTCFRPTAVMPIASATPPFTGDFRPEGFWGSIAGTPINGTWELIVIDTVGDNDLIRVNDWSICFNTDNNKTYTWIPPIGLSCNDCDSVTVTPPNTLTYIVRVQDDLNCTLFDTVNVEVFTSIPGPVITCEVTGFGEMTFSWNPIPGVDSFQVNVNNGGWEDASGPNSHLVTGLTDGQNVSIRVQGFTANGDCPIDESMQTCLYTDPCLLRAALADASPPSCFDASDGAATITGINGVGQVLYSLDGGNFITAGSYSGLAGGSHRVIVVDEEGCRDTLDFTLTPPDSILIQLTADSISCAGFSDGVIRPVVSGGTGAYQFNWQGPGGFNSTDSVVTDLPAGNYCLTVTDENDCSAVVCADVFGPPALMVDVTVTPVSCAGGMDGTATAVVSGGNGGYMYTWDDQAAQSTQVATGLIAGTFTVQVTDRKGCVQTASGIVSAPDSLLIDSITVAEPRCFGNDDGELEVFASGGTGSFTYLWNDPAGQITPLASGLMAGDYSVQVRDANGCLVEGDVTLTQPEELTVTLDATDVLCFGDATGTAEATVEGGRMPYDLMWSNNGNGFVIQQLVAGSYAVSVTDAAGCISEDTIVIDQPVAPVAAGAFQTEQGCFGANANEVQVQGSGGVGSYFFTWSNGRSGDLLTGLSPGIYLVTATDANGCTDEDSVLVEDLEDIDAVFDLVIPRCFGQSNGNISLASVSGGTGNGDPFNYTFDWNTDPPRSGTIINNLPGDIDYRVTVTDQKGCSKEFELFLGQPVALRVGIAKTDVRCFGEDDGVATVIPPGDPSLFTYIWGPLAGNRLTQTVDGLDAGTYSVLVTDTAGCQADTTVAITEPPLLEASFEVTDNRCSDGDEGAVTVIPSGGVPEYTINWETGVNGNSLANLEIGTYLVTIRDANSCLLTDSIEVSSPPPLRADIMADSVSCFGASDGMIMVEPLGGVPPYRFSRDGSTFNSQNVLLGLPEGVYAIFLKDANGCMWDSGIRVDGPPQMEVDAGEDIILELGDSIQLDFEIFNPQGSFTALWEAAYGGTLICDSCALCPQKRVSCPNPWAKPQFAINYEIIVEDSKGCRASDLVRVQVRKEREVYVPSGFTPNGDGLNDLLLVHGKEGTEVLLFRIYDRWGELLYETGEFRVNDDFTGWDGTFKGQAMNPGVYVWYVEVKYIDNQVGQFKGHTNLIR